MRTFLVVADLVILLYLLFINFFYAMLLARSMAHLKHQTRLAEDSDFRRLVWSDSLPPVSVLVPAHNESATIEASVTGLLHLEYRLCEIVVVNDGSTDDTMERLRRAFDLFEIPRIYPHVLPTRPLRGIYRSRWHPRLVVVDKENGGKADALNAAINASRFPWVMPVDADTLLERQALLRLTRPFSLGRESIAALGGSIGVANDCTVVEGRVVTVRLPRRPLPALQVVEYLRAFLYGRLGWSAYRSNILISGAVGLFRKTYLMAVGGYATSHLTEDLDVVVRLHRYLRERRIAYEMPFISDPIAWTEVPESPEGLARQRGRWQRGLILTMWDSRRMFFSLRYGRIGLVTLPFYAFGEGFAPVVESLGYGLTLLGLWLGAVDRDFMLLFFCCSFGFGMMLSLFAIVLEERHQRLYRKASDLLRLVCLAALESIVYRPMTVWWRLRAFLTLWRDTRTWGESVRRGFSAG